jgi:hypothetical protein
VLLAEVFFIVGGLFFGIGRGGGGGGGGSFAGGFFGCRGILGSCWIYVWVACFLEFV